ncbi:hypothetical protein FGO68_gene12280 [Halteria grandinella]|uniref:Uncharacterized protein n=1 Tax=Halteria grandinella TaxID=5974 RepID=A0A8J8T0L2_HALGN|nr:hypothetical protein FGO68_gene12280 [Halteria grandinella]
MIKILSHSIKRKTRAAPAAIRTFSKKIGKEGQIAKEEVKEKPKKSSKFQSLLKFDQSKMKTKADYKTQFDKIAYNIMSKQVLTVNYVHKFRINEVEFYYGDHIHKDDFSLDHPLLRENSTWFFLRYSNGTYVSGSYKGLNISFGKGDKAYGGILLRAMSDMKNQLIEGPSKLADELIRLNYVDEANPEKSPKVEHLVEQKDFSLDIFNKNSRLFLSSIDEPENKGIEERKLGKDIFTGPRCGLNLRKEISAFPEFWLKDYRYMLEPENHYKYRHLIKMSFIEKDHEKAKALYKGKSLKELHEAYLEGLDAKEDDMIKFLNEKRREMTPAFWAKAYGLNTKLYKI